MGPVVAMTWFKLSDRFHQHKKVIAAGNSAVGLWVRCCTWSAGEEEDGKVPKHVAHTLGTRQDIDRLLKAGLWIEVDDYYWTPNFLKHNPSHEQNEARRVADAKRQQLGRDNRRSHGVTDDGVTP